VTPADGLAQKKAALPKDLVFPAGPSIGQGSFSYQVPGQIGCQAFFTQRGTL
jgi:hypothetical protein